MKPVSKLPMFFEDTVTEEKESVHENGSMNEEDSVKEEVIWKFLSFCLLSGLAKVGLLVRN